MIILELKRTPENQKAVITFKYSGENVQEIHAKLILSRVINSDTPPIQEAISKALQANFSIIKWRF